MDRSWEIVLSQERLVWNIIINRVLLATFFKHTFIRTVTRYFTCNLNNLYSLHTSPRLCLNSVELYTEWYFLNTCSQYYSNKYLKGSNAMYGSPITVLSVKMRDKFHVRRYYLSDAQCQSLNPP